MSQLIDMDYVVAASYYAILRYGMRFKRTEDGIVFSSDKIEIPDNTPARGYFCEEFCDFLDKYVVRSK